MKLSDKTVFLLFRRMLVTVYVSLWSQSFENLSHITQFRKMSENTKKCILIEAKINNVLLFLEENDFVLEISSDIVQFLRGMISSIGLYK